MHRAANTWKDPSITIKVNVLETSKGPCIILILTNTTQNVVQVEARVLAVDVDAKFSQDDLAIWSRTHNFVQEFATVEHVTYMIQPEW